ncbi:hypothetical protein N658DRAFT_140452 [Parathielavia hyrcaniae]|uniref:Uncharacterized protein n=1 Tax=Parathielavia hyrcaniae TaxID=113614 RepID=A0AAN6Q383_9PEZI|nr:hypothetical protein N658DRAFT_140452 [Parathielavia hyrcaniae]
MSSVAAQLASSRGQATYDGTGMMRLRCTGERDQAWKFSAFSVRVWRLWSRPSILRNQTNPESECSDPSFPALNATLFPFPSDNKLTVSSKRWHCRVAVCLLCFVVGNCAEQRSSVGKVSQGYRRAGYCCGPTQTHCTGPFYGVHTTAKMSFILPSAEHHM